MPETAKTDNDSQDLAENNVAAKSFATRLAADVSEGFNRAVLFRQTSGVDAKLKYALRAYTRTPSKEEIAFFTAMGVDPESSFDCLTKTKMNSVLALLQRILLPPSGKSYSIEASPSPDVPSHIEGAAYGIILNEYFQYVQLLMEANPEAGEAAASPEAIIAHVNSRKEEIDNAIITFAKTRAKLMDRKVDDLLRESELGSALEDFLWNDVIYGTGVLIGPCEEFRQVVKIKDRKKREKAEVDQTPVYALETEKSMSFYSPQTCDVYPSEGARRAKDGRLYIKVSFEPADLADFAEQSKTDGKGKKLNGWDSNSIEKVLKRYPMGGHNIESAALDGEFKAMKEEAVGTMSNTNIEGIRCFGKFPGKYLIQCGVTESEYVKTINPHKYYEIDCVIIDTEIVYLNVCDPVIGRPVFKSTFYGTTHSWFGDGLSEVLRPFQSLATVCMTGLKKQTQMTSTPERFVNDVDSFVNSNMPGAFSPSPWKVYLRKVNPYQATTATQGAPIAYVQMPHTIREVLQVISALTIMVDDYSGFPRNMFGSGNLSGAARALADYERVLTPKGAVKICDLKIGDEVFNTYSGVSKVLGVYPQGKRDIYRMHFSNGEKIDCDIEHRWTVSDHPERKNSWKTMTTGELLEAGLFRKTVVGKKNPRGYRPKFALPRVESLGYEAKDVPIDPYTLGALLGNGDSRCRITDGDMEVFEQIPYELGVPDVKDGGTCIARTVIGIKSRYHALGLNCTSLEKFIPKDYLHNSEEVRMGLLQGLMDTDGCASENGDHVFFSTSSPKMREDFVELVKSLGATSVSVGTEAGGEFEINDKTRVRQTNYRVLFNLDHKQVFRLERKQSRVTGRARKRIYITGIELLSERHTATCITVDAKDSLYLCENFIPTHNTARGLAQIRESANIVADFVISNIDKKITSPLLKTIVNWLNVRGTDDTIKGDVQIIARGALGQALQTAKEETASAALSIAGNGIFPQILGPKALLLIFRRYLEAVGYDGIDDIIGSKEKMELQEQIQMIQQLQQITQQEQEQQQGAPAGGGRGGVEAPMPSQGQPIGQDIARQTGGGVPMVAGGVQDRRGAA